MKSLMSTALKDNSTLRFATITGCLKIAKESIFTGTNNFVSDTITDSRLNEYFGFASNNKGTGRTDLIMAYMVNEYIKVNLDPEGHDVKFYYSRMKEKTGLDI